MIDLSYYEKQTESLVFLLYKKKKLNGNTNSMKKKMFYKMRAQQRTTDSISDIRVRG